MISGSGDTLYTSFESLRECLKLLGCGAAACRIPSSRLRVSRPLGDTLYTSLESRLEECWKDSGPSTFCAMCINLALRNNIRTNSKCFPLTVPPDGILCSGRRVTEKGDDEPRKVDGCAVFTRGWIRCTSVTAGDLGQNAFPLPMQLSCVSHAVRHRIKWR